ncbi:acetolactate synthase large subunit [Thiohalorhabdus sp.]|uniref:acetolactate synthase large subunit n=1 Tax=Thiohalorhabdus sp. TaxID=3094134 RepID=UPI002FC34693
MNSADCLVTCLESEGTRFVFGLPGEETLAFYEALRESSIHVVTCRHEQGAAFMADVHGRLTGSPGVCVSTLGPGATNLITGVADADLDRAPVVAITGQASLDRTHKESHQYLDLVSLFRPITKWNAQIKRGDVVPEMVRHAFREAALEKPGATHLDLPEDVADAPVRADATPLPSQPLPQPVPPEDELKQAAEFLARSQNALILAGNGIIRAGASEALRRFARSLNIPVAHTFMAKGVFPYDDPLAIMTAGIQARDYVACGFEAADAIICIGYDATEYAPKSWNPNRDKPVLHIAQTPAELDSHYTTAVEVVGDIAEALNYLSDAVTPRKANIIPKLHDPVMRELRAYDEDTSVPFKPQRVIADLDRALDPRDIVVSDVGAHKVWVARMFPSSVPNTCIISNGFASMGIALPGAIAAKLVHPERKVVAIAGDGGALMNIQELETAVRLGTPVVLLVFVDNMYGLIEWKQQQRYGHSTEVGIGNPDWVKLAESFGARGTRVTASDELGPALEWGLDQDLPVILEVPVDARENLKLTEHLGDLVCPI